MAFLLCVDNLHDGVNLVNPHHISSLLRITSVIQMTMLTQVEILKSLNTILS